ncbi:MAG: tol-pal system-associated acyl-CoA thioesterase [Pseudomonadota bacterium]
MAELGAEIAGIIEDGVHRLTVRVYYEDTDFSGAVYHANYLKFCERGRSDCLRLLGIHHHELHWHQNGGSMGFVVRRMECDFLKPAGIDDLLTVESRFKAIRGARMELSQRVLRADDLLFSAEVTVALVAGGRPVRMLSEIADAIAERMKPE